MKDKIFLVLVFTLAVSVMYFLTILLGGTVNDFYHAMIMLTLFQTMEINFRNNDE